MAKRKLILASALAAVAATLAGGASAQQEIQLTAISGLPPASVGTRLIRDHFIPEVDRLLAEKGQYKIAWTQAYAGSVAKQQAILKAVGDGIGDVGYVNTLFEGDKLPLEQITFVTPFGSGNPGKVLDVIDQLRAQVGDMNAAFERQKQVYLGGVVIDTYHVESTFEIKSLDDLKGRKLGAPGLSANWLTGTGATPVAGSLSTYYNSLQTGVYDGIITFESAIAPFKFYEVAKYVALVNIGAPLGSALTINQARFKALPEPVRAALTKVGMTYQAAVAEDYRTSGEKSMEAAKAAGAVITEFPASERQRWARVLPNIAKQWAADLDAKNIPGTKALTTYMDLSRKAGIEHARAWDKE